ncbi:MAG: hypothetical protein ACLUE1_07745 [Adlercreutzia equolifaciens]
MLRDSAAAAKTQRNCLPLDAIVAEAYASVQRTPDLLPVCSRMVLDAGGFGLAIIFDVHGRLLGAPAPWSTRCPFAQGAPQGGRSSR